MTSDSITAARATRARKVAYSAPANPFADESLPPLARLDLDGFIAAVSTGAQEAVTAVARESRRADLQSFQTASQVLGYLEENAHMVGQGKLLEQRFKLDTTAARPDGRQVRLRMHASLPTALLLCGMESMKGGVGADEHSAFCARLGKLMESVDVPPAASIKALADIIKVGGERLDLTSAASALAGVGMTQDHLHDVYSNTGERRNAGPASKALDVLSSAVMSAQYDGKTEIQRSLALATATVVQSPAYAAEYIDPTPILKGASEEVLAKAKARAQEIGAADFAFILTNMLVHHGVPGDKAFKFAFPSNELAVLSMAGHNGITPIPGFPCGSEERAQPASELHKSSIDVPLASGHTPRKIVEHAAQRMTQAPLNGNGDFECYSLRRLSGLMEMRARAGDIGALQIFEPVIKVMASRSQAILYEANKQRPDVVSFLLEQGHGEATDPKFSPKLWDQPGVGWCYEDGFVTASVSVTPEGVSPKAIGILEWSSEHTGQGHTVRALEWFRQQGYEHISAHSVGMLDEIDGELVGDISTLYWAHMNGKGLCDALYDDEGREIQVVHGDPSVGPELRYKPDAPEKVALPDLLKLIRLNDKDLDTNTSGAAFLGELAPCDRGSVLILWSAESHSQTELMEALRSWSEEEQARRVEVLSLAMNQACDHNDLIRGRSSEAANRHMTAVCNVLLKEGADPCVLGEDGFAILHRATVNGNSGMMRFMLDAGCPVDLISSNGYTALGHAVDSSAFTSAQMLLRNGADPNAKPRVQKDADADSMNLSELAEYNMSSSMSWLLLAYGAHKTASMQASEQFAQATPVYAAIQAGDTERMLDLLEAGGAEALKQVPSLRQSVCDAMFSMDDSHEQASREILSALDAFTAKGLMGAIAERSRRHRHSL